MPLLTVKASCLTQAQHYWVLTCLSSLIFHHCPPEAPLGDALLSLCFTCSLRGHLAFSDRVNSYRGHRCPQTHTASSPAPRHRRGRPSPQAAGAEPAQHPAGKLGVQTAAQIDRTAQEQEREPGGATQCHCQPRRRGGVEQEAAGPLPQSRGSPLHTRPSSWGGAGDGAREAGLASAWAEARPLGLGRSMAQLLRAQ